MKLNFDVVIIGAGVAGMTSALYLKRAGLNCLVIEKEIPGGQINLSPKVKNYPGFLEISGKELSDNIFNQIKELGVDYFNGDIKNIDYLNNEIFLNNKNISYKYLIIATGRKPRKLDVEGANKLVGKGVSYCATCDGHFFKGMDVAVIGGGNSALEEALYLSDICNKVTILNRSNKLRGEDFYIKKINKKDNIEIKYNSILKELKTSDERLSSIIYSENNEIKEINVKGCFTYIGYDPNSDMFDFVELDGDGYVAVDNNNMTSIDNVYAVGDIVKKSAFQLITAMNDGVVAATNIINKEK